VDLLSPSIDFAILCDAVQAAGGKLHLVGGGWDNLFVSKFPARHHTLGIGLRVRIPWGSLDDIAEVHVDLIDEDGKSILPSGPLHHQVKARRNPAMEEGTDLGVVRAFTFNNLEFPRPGQYAFVLTIGDSVHRLGFTVRQRPVRN